MLFCSGVHLESALVDLSGLPDKISVVPAAQLLLGFTSHITDLDLCCAATQV